MILLTIKCHWYHKEVVKKDGIILWVKESNFQIRFLINILLVYKKYNNLIDKMIKIKIIKIKDKGLIWEEKRKKEK